MTTYTLGSVIDLDDGEMKEITINEKEILIGKNSEGFFAMDAKCSHYGAPLINGAISGDKVICPWHHACFNSKNGHLVEPPGTDHLRTYPIHVEDGMVRITIFDKSEDKAKFDVETSEQYVIIGGGDAGFYAAKSLRENGFTGIITILSADKYAPYDRIKCSKAFPEEGLTEDKITLKNSKFYKEYSINLKTGEKVVKLNREKNLIVTASGLEIIYDKVLIATGGQARNLSVPGIESKNIFTLRNPDDTNHIIDKIDDASRVVVVGSSFIGMEAASALAKRNLEVYVVSPEEIPFAAKWGTAIGKMLRAVHLENGVIFHSETTVKEFTADKDGRVEGVVLSNGSKLEADLVIVGIGVTPATDFLEGFELQDDKSLLVDEFLRVDENIYAAGDIATFPYNGSPTRIEHWRHAGQQGMVAGSNMAGKTESFDKVPYFWTMQHGKNIRYVGHVKDYESIIYDGEVNDMKFLAFFIKEGEVKAVLGMGRDQDLAAIELLMQNKKMPSPPEIEAGEIKWNALSQQVTI